MTRAGIDKELNAIKTIIEILKGLDDEARERTLKYVTEHLHLSMMGLAPSLPHPRPDASKLFPMEPLTANDIRTFKEQKKPKSDIEMAALVAFYLSELTPADEKKGYITSQDITKYFKQAGFKLPKYPRFTLSNAKNAGYFDQKTKGQYKLNPVGYNLVAYSLPKENANKSNL